MRLVAARLVQVLAAAEGEGGHRDVGHPTDELAEDEVLRIQHPRGERPRPTHRLRPRPCPARRARGGGEGGQPLARMCRAAEPCCDRRLLDQ